MALDLGQNADYPVYSTVKFAHLYSVTPISPRLGYGGFGKPITWKHHGRKVSICDTQMARCAKGYIFPRLERIMRLEQPLSGSSGLGSHSSCQSFIPSLLSALEAKMPQADSSDLHWQASSPGRACLPNAYHWPTVGMDSATRED